MRGRAKGLMRIKDLNRGQKLGMGKNRVSFPGLTDNIKRDKDGNTNMKIEEISKEKYAEYLDDYGTQQMSLLKARGRKKYTPLQRGWTSATPMGQKFGPPESTNPDGNLNYYIHFPVSRRETIYLSMMEHTFNHHQYYQNWIRFELILISNN